MQHILAIDAGTTGVTAVLFDRELRQTARADREFAQSFPSPGRVEHAAEDILGAVDATVAELARHPAFASVAALGLTNQRETIFAVERATGRALAPGIVWQDRRTEERCRELERSGRLDLVRRTSGLLLDPYFSATKIEWMLAHDAAIAAAHAANRVVFATVDALVLAHLTGAQRWVTDVTNASRTMLFDLERRAWSPELMALFGVREDALPRVLPSIADFGTSVPARTGGRSLPIRGVAGDQQAALFGQGGYRPGVLKATFGTGSFLVLPTFDERVVSEGGLLTTLTPDASGQPAFALEGSTFVCGALVQWMRDQLGLFERAADIEALAASVPDANGVTIVPAFAGLGAPYWDAGARGAILGLTRGVTRAHLARAALDAIAWQNAELVELMRQEAASDVEALAVDGGAAANDLLMQLCADASGARVLRGDDVEATARGAALLAGLGASLWQHPDEPEAMQQRRDSFLPRSSPDARREGLSRWRAEVRRVRTNDA
ncbi:MAG: glycerol kinase GlpK [Planctomycetota bacterium]